MRTKKGVDVPTELAIALEAHPAALEAFERMPPSHQRQHVDYFAEAVKPETRARRAAKVLEMVDEWGREHPPAGAKGSARPGKT